MSDSANEREIEVRSLTGESIRVSIEANKTVQDLKLLLKHTFSPASSSPNFHLFLKGLKLNLKSQISNYLIGVGDFLVVVPFVTKDRKHMHGVEASETPSEDPNSKEKFESNLAESAWSDLMEDLSSYQDTSNDQNVAEIGFMSMNFEIKNAHDSTTSSRTIKRKKELNSDKEKGTSYNVILSILQASGDNLCDEQIVKKFLEFMDCSSCLSNPATGFCVMRESSALPVSEIDPCNSTLCLCPLWLKDLMMAFYFINVYSACLQLWQKRITISALKPPLDQLHKIGFRPDIADLELLPQLCPQAICIVNSEIEATKLPDALVITRFTADINDQHEDDLNTAAKRLPRSKIVNAMKKRETSLKAVLSKAAKSLMLKNGSDMIKPFSLEDLLVFVKKAHTTADETRVKRERRCSPASGSDSYEVHCHDTKSLLPEEMVEHLRSTVGTRGQVVHIEKISARNAKYVEIPCQLSDNVKSALKRVGITRLYSHQKYRPSQFKPPLLVKM